MSDESVSTERIWELFSKRLKSFFLQRVSDEQVADDLLQETFLSIHTKLEAVRDSQRITSWVFQIARNLVVDYYRSKARTASALADELEAETNPEDNLNDLVRVRAEPFQFVRIYLNVVSTGQIRMRPKQDARQSV